MKTRSLMMKKYRNLKNEINTRWGDSINLLYCSHIINKSRRSDGSWPTVMVVPFTAAKFFASELRSLRRERRKLKQLFGIDGTTKNDTDTAMNPYWFGFGLNIWLAQDAESLGISVSLVVRFWPKDEGESDWAMWCSEWLKLIKFEWLQLASLPKKASAGFTASAEKPSVNAMLSCT